MLVCLNILEVNLKLINKNKSEKSKLSEFSKKNKHNASVGSACEVNHATHECGISSLSQKKKKIKLTSEDCAG